MLNAAFGLGAAIGPGVGAALIIFGEVAPLYFVAFLAFVSAAAICILLPERSRPRKREEVKHLSWFDPRVVPDRPEGLTPFAAFLTDSDRWYRSPHPSWDLAAYLLANPDAEDHPLGPLGHLELDDDTMLDIVDLEGTARRWGGR